MFFLCSQIVLAACIQLSANETGKFLDELDSLPSIASWGSQHDSEWKALGYSRGFTQSRRDVEAKYLALASRSTLTLILAAEYVEQDSQPTQADDVQFPTRTMSTFGASVCAVMDKQSDRKHLSFLIRLKLWTVFLIAFENISEPQSMWTYTGDSYTLTPAARTEMGIVKTYGHMLPTAQVLSSLTRRRLSIQSGYWVAPLSIQ